MTVIKFDPSGCIDANWGITPDQLEPLRDPLSAVRDEMVAAADQSPESSFLQLPWQQYSEYQQHREESLLGHIFQIANSIHDQIDAVVVLGSEQSILGARALMQACCDPYHNELNRAARGSKPRMYFTGGNLDSDAISALLNRVAPQQFSSTGHDNDAVANRWALIVIDQDNQQDQTAIVLQNFLSAMEQTLGHDAANLMPRFVIPVASQGGWLAEMATTMGSQVVIGLPKSIENQFTMLSATSLLPAAMLGLDCMKLLGGAHEMTKHFAEADYSENMVLQFVAVNQLLEVRGRSVRSMKVWSSALAGVQQWYEAAFSELNFASSFGTRHNGKDDPVIHQLVPQTPRCDPLMVGREQTTDMQTLHVNAIAQANQTWRDIRQPTTTITMPNTDFLAIGELFQFLMITSAIETSGLSKRS